MVQICAQNGPRYVWRPGSARTRWAALESLAAMRRAISKGEGKKGSIYRGMKGRRRERVWEQIGRNKPFPTRCIRPNSILIRPCVQQNVECINIHYYLRVVSRSLHTPLTGDTWPALASDGATRVDCVRPCEVIGQGQGRGSG